MAAPAVAASAAVLKPVIAKLSGEVWKNLSKFWGLEKECDNLKNMLTNISLVLADAEKKSISDGLIRNWLLQLQDVAYGIDDLLDGLQIEAQRRNKNKSTIRAIQDFFSSDNRVKFRATAVNNLVKITERLHKIMKEKNNFELVEGKVLIEEEDHTERETISAVNEHEVYGRKEEKEILINLLIRGSTQNEKLSVLPLVGMPGVGKTTLAQIICRDPIIKKHFDPIIWVHVPLKFELRNILHKLIECVSGKNCDVSSIEAMQNKVGTMISGAKFLLVLDDVWNEDAAKWEKLRTVLSCGMVGSKVLVTTRNENIAKIMGTIDHFRVNVLEFQYCWELFKERAFRNVKQNEDANLVKIGEEIVKKCKGLPLATKHLGNLAGYREVDWSVIRDNDIWQMDECRGGIVNSLLLSYIYLPSNLKRCFAYCSLFPKGYMFKKDFLIQLWTCEGFIPKKVGGHFENTANLCFEYLLSRSFFEESERAIGDSRIYRMHDLIHDLACYVAGDKFFLRSEGEYDQKSVSWRYSSVCFNDVSVVRNLRSLLLLNGDKNLGIKLNSIMQLQFLRVLDISGSQIEVLPCTIGNLRHLRYLNVSGNNFNMLPNAVTALLSLEVLDLSWCEQLQMIPINLGVLENLEVLNLSGCSNIKNLPMSLCRLTELRILDLTYCKSLISIPKGIGNLTKLERLPFFIIGDEEGCTIGELRQLNLLKHDLQIVVGEDWGVHDIHNSNLGAKQYLKSIKLKSGSKPIGRIELPRQLENLCIESDGSDLPSSLITTDFASVYTNLIKVEIHHINEWKFIFPEFGKLPKLKSLCLSLRFSITKIKEQFSGNCGKYRVLEELELSEVHHMVGEVTYEETTVETGAFTMMFPCLKKAKFFSCPFTEVFPFLPRSIEKLNITGDCGKHILSVKSLQGLLKLRKLRLVSVYIEFNEFERMRYLTALEELQITYCKWSYLPPTLLQQRLPSLKSLLIESMYDLLFLDNEILEQETDESSRYSPPPLFATLEKLLIADCNLLRELPEWLGKLPSLQSLKLSYLPRLEKLPRGTEQLTSLQKLTIFNCLEVSKQYRVQQWENGEVYYKREECGNWYVIYHIPYIYIYPIMKIEESEIEVGRLMKNLP